jgi:hypothetical protein
MPVRSMVERITIQYLVNMGMLTQQNRTEDVRIPHPRLSTSPRSRLPIFKHQRQRQRHGGTSW